MKFKTKMFLSALVLMVGLFAAACPERRSIADIEANPSKYLNKEVAIAGVVQDSYGVNVPFTNIRGGAYKVSDGTGSIWVVTEDSVPARGTQLGIKGKVQNGVNWKGKNYGLALIENDRRFKKTK
jgi:glycerol kinase